nr:phage tail tip lysozyme [Enterococcus sp. HY326]
MPSNLDANGITLIDWLDNPEINRIINNKFSFYGNYKVDGKDVDYLKKGYFIKALDEDYRWKYFEIYDIVKNLNSYSVTARAIGYMANRNFIDYSFTSSGTGAMIMNNLKAALAFEQPFNYSSNVSTVHQFTAKQVNPIEAIIGSNNGNQNLVGVAAAELDMDNYDLKLVSQIGSDNGYRIDIGINLESVQEEINEDNVYNSLYLVGGVPENDYDEDKDPITYKYLEVEGVTDANRRIGKRENSNIVDEDELIKWGQSLFDVDRVHEAKVTHTVSMVSLEHTLEYGELYNQLSRLHFGDVAYCSVKKLGIDVKERMVEYAWYPTLGKFKQIVMGNDLSMYTNTVNTETAILKRKVENRTEILVEAVRNASSWITGNTEGHILLRPEKAPSEILIMDTTDAKTAKKVWRWNLGGLGYSSTGVDGPFGLAMTQDGAIVADFITTGILRAIRIEGVEIFGSLFETFNEVATQLIQINAGRLAFMLNEKDENGNRKVIGDLNPIFSSDAAGIGFNVQEGNVLSIGMNPTATAGGQYVLRIPETSTNANPLLQLKGRIDLDGEFYIGGQKVTPGGTGGGGGGWNGQYPEGVTSSADQFAWQAWITLLNLGYSKEAAAGILGNIQGEAGSSMNPDTEQNGGPAYGAIQMDGSRYPLIPPPTDNGREYFQRLHNASGVGGDYREMTTQMKVVNWAMTNGQWIEAVNPTSVDGFKNVGSPETAAYAFEKNFERPAADHPERQGWARQWYEKFKDLQQPGGTGGYALPVREGTPVTSWFGPRWGTMHNGIDFGAPLGDPIFASKDGTVVQSMPTSASGGFGEYIIVQHDDGYMTGYAHLTTRMKQVGDVVSQGQQIGTCGSTGDSTGPHLHFSIQTGTWGPYVDPVPFLGLTPP